MPITLLQVLSNFYAITTVGFPLSKVSAHEATQSLHALQREPVKWRRGCWRSQVYLLQGKILRGPSFYGAQLALKLVANADSANVR